MVDSKVTKSVLGETDFSVHGKQPPVAIKKTPLRDLQNENSIRNQKPTGNLLLFKEDGAGTEDLKVSSTKRPPDEYTVSPSHHQSPSNNGSSGHLVYVRRKFETEAVKNSSNDTIGHKTDCLRPRPIGPQEDIALRQPQIKESRMQCSPAFALIPTASLMTFSSSTPSVPLSFGKPNSRAGSQQTCGLPVTLSIPSSDQRGMNNQNWEERYLQLQIYLKKLDQSSQEDYLQMLRSLSSVELSRHAVDLEKRAIQLSLEEGKELQRVRALNVLGKSIRNSKVPPVQQGL